MASMRGSRVPKSDSVVLQVSADTHNSPLRKSLCRRGRANVVEDKARDRVPSFDSARERNAVFRPQGPAVARMDFFNGLIRRGFHVQFQLYVRRSRVTR